jgi:hypothetical protein
VIKVLVALALLAGLGWVAYDRLEIGQSGGRVGGPTAPDPGVDRQAGDAVGGVGDATAGALN